MSVTLLRFAHDHLSDFPLTPTEKLVLLCLCDYANETSGKCYPSVQSLVSKSGLGRATVFRALIRLEESRIFQRDTSAGKSTSYLFRPCSEWQVLEDDPYHCETRINVRPVSGRDPSHSETNPSHGETDPSHSETNPSHGETQTSKEPVKNQVKNQVKECIAQNADQTKDDQSSLISLSGSSSEDGQNAESSSRKIVSESNDVPQQETPAVESKPKKRKTAKKKEPVSAERPDDIPVDLWEDFLRHRKAKKASVVSERALTLIRNEAQKAGWTMEAAINETILRDWKSFKADWVNKSGYSKKNDSFNNSLPPHKDPNSAMYLPDYIEQPKSNPRADALLKEMVGDEEDIPF